MLKLGKQLQRLGVQWTVMDAGRWYNLGRGRKSGSVFSTLPNRARGRRWHESLRRFQWVLVGKTTIAKINRKGRLMYEISIYIHLFYWKNPNYSLYFPSFRQTSEKPSGFNVKIPSHYMQPAREIKILLIKFFTLFVTKYAKKATAFKQYQIELTPRIVLIQVHRTTNIPRWSWTSI